MRDLNTFKEGDIVDVSDIDEYQNAEITRISDSGVTIKVSGVSHVLSGRSPATLATPKVALKVTIEQPEAQTGERVKRGTYTAKMNNIIVPPDAFTIKQLAELNNIPVPYAHKWVTENCQCVGVAPKPEGQRGKTAKLYKKE